MQAQQIRELINAALHVGRQLLSHTQVSTAPSHVPVTWEDKHPHSYHPTAVFFPKALCAEHDALWSGRSPGLVEVSCPSSVPSQLLVHSQCTCWWNVVKSRNSLDSVQVLLSSNENIPLLLAQNQKTAPYQLLGRKLTLSE